MKNNLCLMTALVTLVMTSLFSCTSTKPIDDRIDDPIDGDGVVKISELNYSYKGFDIRNIDDSAWVIVSPLEIQPDLYAIIDRQIEPPTSLEYNKYGSRDGILINTYRITKKQLKLICDTVLKYHKGEIKENNLLNHDKRRL